MSSLELAILIAVIGLILSGIIALNNFFGLKDRWRAWRMRKAIPQVTPQVEEISEADNGDEKANVEIRRTLSEDDKRQLEEQIKGVYGDTYRNLSADAVAYRLGEKWHLADIQAALYRLVEQGYLKSSALSGYERKT